MKTYGRWGLALLGGVLVAGAAGCGTLKSMGFESRSARIAREKQTQIDRLQMENAKAESVVAAQQNQGTALKIENEKLKLLLQKGQDKPVVDSASVEQRWRTLAQRLGGDTAVTADGTKCVRLKGDILFLPGKTDVRSTARPMLSRIANVLKTLDEDIVVYVDGHTDSDPLRVTKDKYGDNYGLGAARANAVIKELVAMGVPRAKLVPRSFGQDHPIGDNKTADGKGKNRRVELSFAFGALAAEISRTPIGRAER